MSPERCVASHEGVTVFALFSGADLIGEFDSGAGRARLDEAVAAEPSTADELAVFAFDESGERVGEPITRAVA